MARKQKGYTIVEVMIFLAVSGALLSMAILGMGGQQERVRFRQSMEDIELRIRSTLNNVDQGYSAKADNSKTYTCNGAVQEQQVKDGNGNSIIQSSSCVFVGREINFCNSADTYVVSKVAPYNNADYANKDSRIAGVIDASKESFAVSADVKIAAKNPAYCRVAALYSAIGTSNNRVPRYIATDAGAFVAIDDTNPTVLCFTNGSKYATLTLYQADIKLLVDTQKCN